MSLLTIHCYPTAPTPQQSLNQRHASSMNLEIALRYLAAVESGARGEALAAFYTEDAVQEELPNRLMPNGARRELAEILAAAERGAQGMQQQRYNLISSTAEGNRVVLEVEWTGRLAVPLGSIPVGGEMRARFAMVMEFRSGRIARQRNYDCFDPWE